MLAFPFNSLAKEGPRCPSLVPSGVHFISKTVKWVSVSLHRLKEWADRCLNSSNLEIRLRRCRVGGLGGWKGPGRMCPCVIHLHIPWGPVGWGRSRGGTEISPYAFSRERTCHSADTHLGRVERAFSCQEPEILILTLGMLQSYFEPQYPFLENEDNSIEMKQRAKVFICSKH